MAPLQKRALYALMTGLAFAIALLVVFITKGGVSTFDEDAGFRLMIDGLWIAVLVVNGVFLNFMLHKPGQVDERDRLIMDKAPRIQWLAVIFTMVTCTIALPEAYHATGEIPTIFLYLIFVSVLIVSTLAQSLGILIGYWRAGRYG